MEDQPLHKGRGYHAPVSLSAPPVSAFLPLPLTWLILMGTRVYARASPQQMSLDLPPPPTTTQVLCSPSSRFCPSYFWFLASLLLHFSERFSTQFFLFSYSLCLSVPPRQLTEMAFAKANRYSHVVKFNKWQSAPLHFFLFTQSQECWTQFTILPSLITLQGFHDFTYSCFCFLFFLSALVYFFFLLFSWWLLKPVDFSMSR